MRRLALGALVVVLAAAAVTAGWLARELSAPYLAGERPEVFVDIPRGASSARIARLLQTAGVIRRQLPFRIHLARTGLGRRLQAGEYRFTTAATPIEVAARLARGDVVVVVLTVPEGLTADETVARAVAAGLGEAGELRAALARTVLLADLAPEATTLEGYLFPETYRFPRAATSGEVIAAMVRRFREVYTRLTRELPAPAGWSAHRIATLASMIEKETGEHSERPLVGSVLVNRLRLGMPLACDPTVIYALRLAGRFDGNIRKADLAIDSPYNTYRYPGLPPGPIANPGEAALRAALRPAASEYLYFVARNDGTHAFSRSYREHIRAIARFQLHGRPPAPATRRAGAHDRIVREGSGAPPSAPEP